MRANITWIAAALALTLATERAGAQEDPLPSWNDGPAKQAIVAFVRETTDPSSPKLVPAAERIATFDQDGTLWVEQPMYTQVLYCLERVPAVGKARPELAKVEPFKTVLSGDREAMAKLGMRDLEKILAATLTGMTVEEFNAEVRRWLEAAREPRWKRPYTELIYQPMLEVMQYLRANGYRTYIVTGGGQDFVRVYSERVYGVPPEQVVGTAGATQFGSDKAGKPILTKEDHPLTATTWRPTRRAWTRGSGIGMGAEPSFWKRCATCKKELPFASPYWACNVSTCNRPRTALAFCSVSCWDAHVPMLRHRDAWTEERRAPNAAEWARQQREAETKERRRADRGPARS